VTRVDGAAVRRDVAAALPGWVLARAATLFALGLAHILADRVDPDMVRVGPRLAQGLLSWDADWYYDIARHGYAALPRESLRFFPLVPVLARALSPLVLGHVGLALLVLANVPALALGAMVHRLTLVETADEALARRAAWLVALVPPFFVLAMGYAEPIALCLSVGAFLALRRRKWGWAAAAGFLAALARPVGLLLAVPAAVEAWRGWGEAGGRERAARVLAVVAPPVGTAAFLAWVWARFDDPLLPFRVQQRSSLRGGFAVPVVTLFNALSRWASGEVVRNLIHVPWVVAFVALVVVAFRRWPASYGAFAAAALVVGTSARYWGSMERYGFGAFPLVLALASATSAPWAERATLVLCGALMTGYAVCAFLNLYVP
jgi:hypothetical protein